MDVRLTRYFGLKCTAWVYYWIMYLKGFEPRRPRNIGHKFWLVEVP